VADRGILLRTANALLNQAKKAASIASSSKRVVAAKQQGGSGNFSQDREKASEAGRKGGQR